MIKQDYLAELVDYVKTKKPTKRQINQKKIELCTKYKAKKIPTDIEVLCSADAKDVEELKKYLLTKPTRTISGVAVIAIMSAPYGCPHGKCTFCPGGPKSYFGDVPQSYTGNEPSTMRGIRNDFDSYRIVFNRLEQYLVIGQNPEKADVIIMGGTFPALEREYKEDFVRNIYKAMNDFSNEFYDGDDINLTRFREFFELPGNVNDKDREDRIKRKVLALRDSNIKPLEEEKKLNELANIRCIGLTVETKPDWGFLSHGNEMLEFGTTRVELGIQSVYDRALKVTNRGHNIEDSIRSIRELKDLGFKLNFHMMPGMPGISKDEDIESLKEIFSNPDYRPDMLKVYPTLVMPGTPLKIQYDKGQFTPITTKEAAEIIVEAKKYVPRYCRIMRVQRDIPTKVTEAGVDRTNLRQYVLDLQREKGVVCNCIRCREIKRDKIHGEPEYEILEYDSSHGKDYFISFKDDNDKLLGFCRLRFVSQSLRDEITPESAIIRELHVYGMAVGLGDKGKVQHKGLGRRLVEKAEEIAKSEGRDKMLVISGVGVKEYYKKLGYSDDGPYVSKIL